MIVAAVILYGTLSSDPAGVEHLPMFPGADKLIHAVMFGGLAGALAFDWQRAHRGEIVSKKLMAVFCAACIVAGGLDEIAQGAMENGRAADVFDFVADIAGVAVAFFAAPPAVRRVIGGGRRG